MSIGFLPTEIILAICEYLEARELCTLSRTCRALHELIETLAWPSYLLSNPRPSITHRLLGSPRAQAALNHLVDHAWSSRAYLSRAISDPYPRLRPALALSPFCLALGAGEQVSLFPIGGDAERGRLYTPTVHKIHPRDTRRDITALAFLPSSSASPAELDSRNLLIARADGLIQRYTLSPSGSLAPSAQYPHPASPILSLSVSGPLAAVGARNGQISLIPWRSPWLQPSTLQVPGKPWSVHFLPALSALAVGSVGLHPLTIHPLTPSGTFARASHTTTLSGPDKPSAVYGLTHAPPGSIWGSSGEHVVISGWYDSLTRVHDLRSPASRSQACLTLQDPWDDSPVYCVAAGGGGGNHIAAGGGRHGVVRVWDVRQPKSAVVGGWSAFAPGKDRSPVYGLVMEGSRVFGVTEARAFVLDFDPRAGARDYPSTPITDKVAKRERDSSLLGEWTPHYLHGMMKIDTSKRRIRE